MWKYCFFGMILAGTVTSRGNAQQNSIAVPKYGSTYPEIRTWDQQARLIAYSRAQSLDQLRSIIRVRYGDRGLQRMFGNLSGSRSIDPSIPGVRQTVLLATSSNANVAKGHRRTLLYATRFYNSPEFQL